MMLTLTTRISDIVYENKHGRSEQNEVKEREGASMRNDEGMVVVK